MLTAMFLKKLYSITTFVTICNIVSIHLHANSATKGATAPDINFYYKRYAYQAQDEPDYLNLSKSEYKPSNTKNETGSAGDNKKWSYQKSDNSLENRINSTDFEDEEDLPLENKDKSLEKPKQHTNIPVYDEEDLEGRPYKSTTSLEDETVNRSGQLEKYYTTSPVKKDNANNSSALSDIIKNHNNQKSSTNDLTPTISEPSLISDTHKQSKFEYFCDYVSSNNESIASIATKFHTPLNKFIGQIDNYQEGTIKKGTKFTIPVKYHKVTKQNSGFSDIATEYTINVEEIKKLNKQISEPIPLNKNVILPIFDPYRQIKISYPESIETHRIEHSSEYEHPIASSLQNEEKDSSVKIEHREKAEKDKTPPQLSSIAQTVKTSASAAETIPPKPVKKEENLKLEENTAIKERSATANPEIVTPYKKPDNLDASNIKTELPLKNKKFIWPLNGKIIHSFENNNDGIYIQSEIKTPVLAVADGEVIFSAVEKTNYGNIIIIKHKDDYVSVYGHNHSLLAKKGQHVKQGDKIALSGKSGSVTLPQLYFSLRYNKKAVDPGEYLQK